MSVRALAVLVALLLLSGVAGAQNGAPLRVHVKGAAQFQAIATRDADGFVVRGELVDDAGAAVPKREIAVSALSEDRKPVRLGAPTSCDRDQNHRLGRGGEEVALETDDRGAFCARFRETISKGLVHLRFEGKPLHDPAELEVAIKEQDDHFARTILRFEPPPDVIDLDRDSVTITASLRVDREDAARLPADAVKREGQTLKLVDERGASLGETTTGGDGRAKFEVKTRALDGAGEGKLVVSFAGAGPLGPSSGSAAVVRRAEVHLSLAKELGAVDPNDGFAIEIDATSSRGPVNGGVVEVLRGGESVGAAPIEAGHAKAFAAFASGGKPLVPIVVRFVPSAPWWRAGPELHVDVHVSGPGWGKEILLGLVVLGIAVWIVYGWRRAPKPKLIPGVDRQTAPPSGRAGVQVLGPSVGFGGWRGFVSDAHDGSPVPRATLKIVVPAFDNDGVIAWVSSDENGAFSIEGAFRSDARLVVESETHSTYEQTLPPPSTLAVALVTRRRALLERLVKWAKRQGAPYDGAPEPTPGHVRRTAARTNAEPIESWARKVENAAYGPETVDASVEQEVRSNEPRAGR